jgi:hypothetical protein
VLLLLVPPLAVLVKLVQLALVTHTDLVLVELAQTTRTALQLVVGALHTTTLSQPTMELELLKL